MRTGTAEDIPSNLTVGGIPIAAGRAADSFAEHFHEKVKLNVAKTKVVVNNELGDVNCTRFSTIWGDV